MFTGDAIIDASVRTVIKTASAHAINEGRTLLEKTDVEYGITFHWCRIYPFCQRK